MKLHTSDGLIIDTTNENKISISVVSEPHGDIESSITIERTLFDGLKIVANNDKTKIKIKSISTDAQEVRYDNY